MRRRLDEEEPADDDVETIFLLDDDSNVTLLDTFLDDEFMTDDNFTALPPMSDEEFHAQIENDFSNGPGVYFSIADFEPPDDGVTRFMTVDVVGTQIMKATVYIGDSCDNLSCHLAEAGAKEYGALLPMISSGAIKEGGKSFALDLSGDIRRPSYRFRPLS